MKYYICTFRFIFIVRDVDYTNLNTDNYNWNITSLDNYVTQQQVFMQTFSSLASLVLLYFY